MKILVLDTSSERGMVALLENEELLAVNFFGQQANPIMSKMEELFFQLGLDPAELGCIAVGVGPGSYTGIRIAGMVAKALSFAKKIPLVGLPSLLTWMPEKEGSFAVAIDAKISGLYILLGNAAQDGTLTYEECRVLPLAEALIALRQAQHIYTPHASLIQKRLALSFPDLSLTDWQWHEESPNPCIMARLALKSMQVGTFSLDGTLEMLYLRKTQAEIEREQKQL